MLYVPDSTLAISAILISPWKIALIYVAFLPWAWLVASKLDKDARHYYLNRRTWNGFYMAAGIAGLAAMLLVPTFYAGWPVGVLVLLAPVLVYWRVRNQEVPESKRFYLSGDLVTARLESRRKAKAAKDALIIFIDADGEPHDLPQRDNPEYAHHMLVEDLVGPSIEARAQRVEIAVGGQGVAVSQTVDGMRYKREPMASEQALQMIDYIKRYAGLDVEDRRRQQTGAFKIDGPDGKAVLNVTTAGTSNSLALRVEFDRADRLQRAYDTLGLLPSQKEAFDELDELHNRHGIILVGAPPGHGLTTTLYSLISRHDAYTSNIKTLEREVMVRLDGIDHVQWDPSNPEVDYATHLQSILRRDPDIVLTDFMKDQATARVIAEPGLEGPLLYVPQRAGSVIDQVREWVKIVGNVKQATRALRAVANQRLVRTLCPACRQAYEPTPDQLRKLKLPAGKIEQLYRASGQVQVKNKVETCQICRGTGYLGQTAAFELFIVDDEARKLLTTGDLKAALAHARRNKMIFLQEAALRKVVNGETTIEEVIRITAPARGGESDAKTPAPGELDSAAAK